MRISHSSIKRQNDLNELLSQESSIEKTYVPQSLVNAEEQTYVPTLVNYIFVQASLKNLKEIKADKAKYENLRYVMAIGCDESFKPFSEIAFVPDGFACKPGEKVRITNGEFKGIEGTLKSIKKHLCVVIPIKNVLAVAITNVPRKYLQKIED